MSTTVLHQPVQIRQAATEEAAQQALKLLRKFICSKQLAAIDNAMRGEEQAYFFQKVVDLAELITSIPVTYETDGQGQNAVAYLHYFTAGCDWYITELDVLVEQHQAFGLADMGCPEFGYISIVELLANNGELDLYWSPKPLRDIARGQL